MARGGHVFRLCEICKQTYIIAQKTRSPSDKGKLDLPAATFWCVVYTIVPCDNNKWGGQELNRVNGGCRILGGGCQN